MSYIQLHHMHRLGKPETTCFSGIFQTFKLYEEPVRLEDFWAIQPCTHRGRLLHLPQMGYRKADLPGKAFGIERPPQSWCYVEELSNE